MFDPESQAIIDRMNDEWVFHVEHGRALCIRTGVTAGKEGFLQYAARYYGTLQFTRSVTDPKTGMATEVQDEIASGVYWWNGTPQGKRVINQVVFEPGRENPPEVLNTWGYLQQEMCTPNLAADINKIYPLVERLMYLSDGDGPAVMHFLNALAHHYRFPGDKPRCAVVMHSRHGQVGKSSLYLLLKSVFGQSMTSEMPGHELHSRFTDSIFGQRVIVVNELAAADKKDSFERFKSLVTESTLLHEGKGKASVRVASSALFLITTNQEDALPLMRGDPRVLVISCTQPRRPQKYYDDWIAWAKGPGPADVAGVFTNWAFPEGWSAHAPVPQTKAAERMQDAASGGFNLLVKELFEDGRAPFDKDFGTSEGVLQAISTLYGESTRAYKMSAFHLGKAMKQFGCEGSTWVRLANGPQRVWMWRNQKHWQDIASPQERSTHLVTPTPPSV